MRGPVVPAKAGTSAPSVLGSCLRRNDEVKALAFNDLFRVSLDVSIDWRLPPSRSFPDFVPGAGQPPRREPSSLEPSSLEPSSLVLSRSRAELPGRTSVGSLASGLRRNRRQLRRGELNPGHRVVFRIFLRTGPRYDLRPGSQPGPTWSPTWSWGG